MKVRQPAMGLYHGTTERFRNRPEDPREGVRSRHGSVGDTGYCTVCQEERRIPSKIMHKLELAARNRR